MTYKERYEYQKEITIKQREVINSQKATIKRLHWLVERKAEAYSVVLEKHKHELETAKAEAIKEFAERLNKEVDRKLNEEWNFEPQAISILYSIKNFIEKIKKRNGG